MTKFSKPVWWLLYLLGNVTFWATFSVTWHGDRRRRNAPALIVGKHYSYWDISLLSIAAHRIYRTYPHFEMGTFYGYPFLGRVQWIMELYGAFCVMRPKDLIRIKHGTKKSKEELMQLMERVNDEAAQARRWVLTSKRGLVYFPEGARDPQLTRFRSKYELEEVVDYVNAGNEVSVHPMVGIYGPKPKFPIPFLVRRHIEAHILEPVPVRGRTVDEVLDEIRAKMAQLWPAPAPAAKTAEAGA